MNGFVAVRTGNINTVLFNMFLCGFFQNVLYIGVPRDLDILLILVDLFSTDSDAGTSCGRDYSTPPERAVF